ncbi:MAG TPA: DUF3568 family protein [Candidatus Binatia bacterium]|nr:DUF3568 family protein [Candidatus Binatia bacterium]
MLKSLGGCALILAVAVASQGCAEIGVGSTLASVNYTLDAVAYRTFSAPVDRVRRATLSTFRRMNLELKSDQATDDGCRELIAASGDRTVYVELDRLTARTTRMRITAKQGWMLRDRATAGEFIVLSERALDDRPAVTQRVK